MTYATQTAVENPQSEMRQPAALKAASEYWHGTDEAQAALVAALAKAYLEFDVIGRDADGQIGNRYFKYAPLVNLTEATRRQLAKQGCVVLQSCVNVDASRDKLVTQLCGHGARYVCELTFKRPEVQGSDRDSGVVSGIKEWGKATTYLRRYGYQMLLVLDGEPDADDGGKPAQEGPRREPPTPPKPEARRAQPEKPAEKTAPRPSLAPQANGGTLPPVQGPDLSAVHRGEPVDLRSQPRPGDKVEKVLTAAQQEKILTTPVEPPSVALPALVADEPHVELDDGLDQIADSEITPLLVRAAGELKLDQMSAGRKCLQVTGKALRECSRDEKIKLLRSLRADLRLVQVSP